MVKSARELVIYSSMALHSSSEREQSLPFGWCGAQKEVNGAVVRPVRWQGSCPGLAEYLSEVVVPPWNPLPDPVM